MHISGYRAMWVLAFFDLPVKTAKQRRIYTDFRKFLLRDGFRMMQYSVYTRHCPSEENAAVHIKRIESNLPAQGDVRILAVTDRQFERMRTFWGGNSTPTEKPRGQLVLF